MDAYAGVYLTSTRADEYVRIQAKNLAQFIRPTPQAVRVLMMPHA